MKRKTQKERFIQTDWPTYYIDHWTRMAAESQSMEELQKWQAMVDAAKIIQSAISQSKKLAKEKKP